MSDTSEALSNVRMVRRVLSADDRGRVRGLITWLGKAAEAVTRDLVMPDHFAYHVEVSAAVPGGALVVECEKCTRRQHVESVAEAADFRDAHYYCASHVPCWRCPDCDHWAFAFEDRCRFCDHERDVPVATGDIPIDDVVGQLADYNIYLPGRAWRALVRCNSLLRARQAARAMYPRREAEVRLVCNERVKGWNAEG